MNKVYLVGGFLGLSVQAAIEVESAQEAEILKPLLENNSILSNIKICTSTSIPLQQGLLKRLDAAIAHNKKDVEKISEDFLQDKDIICLE